MSASPEHTWHRAALIHDSFWLIPMSKIERLAYFYFSTYCQRPWPVSLVLMCRNLACDNKRLKRAVDSLIARKMVARTRTKTGKACLYNVTLMTLQGWGQTPLPLGSNAPTYLGSNDPSTKGQMTPLTTALSKKAMRLGDSELLSVFVPHLRTWTFNRRPIGRKFLFTRAMNAQALELLRHLAPTHSTTAELTAFLDGCRDYLALPRDVLTEGRDQRALSPVRWLMEWPEQIRLAGIFVDERAQKITRINTAP